MRIQYFALFLTVFLNSSAVATPQSPVKELGKKWTLKEMVIEGKSVKAVKQNEISIRYTQRSNTIEEQTTLEIRGKKIQGYGGANQFFGDIEIDESGTFMVKAFGSTSAASIPQEEKFFSLLEKVSRYTIKDQLLTLEDATGKNKIFMEPYADPPKLPLSGTVWKLKEFGFVKTNNTFTRKNQHHTLQIRDGKVSGLTGNNGFSGKATHDKGTLKIQLSTGKGTTGEAQRYLEVLEEVATYKIFGDQLTISAKDGSHSLVFQGSPPQK